MNLLGVTQIRVNDGVAITSRPALRIEGAAIVDDPARKRLIMSVDAKTRTRLNVTIGTGDYWVNVPSWFGAPASSVSSGWSAAQDVYLTASSGSVRFAGFAANATVKRKTILNAGSNAFVVANFRSEESDSDDPGMLLGRARTLQPGDSVRLVLDPISQLWLVNDGQPSADFLTNDGDIVTNDGVPITVG